jgi:LmbE family N-acetylglucosaminyl deacetylase
MTTLVVAAHPDDEVLGCGGTMARLIREGNDIYIAILGEGMTSRYQQRDQANQSEVEALRSQSRQVAEFLGAKDLFLFDLPDNRFDTVPLLDVIKKVEELIERLQPQVVYTHHSGDLNIDHSIVHRATLTATRPVQRCPVKAVYAYEVPSSTDWAYQQFQSYFYPNVFVDISSTLKKKIEAMALYDSETQPFPHPRSDEAVAAIAQRWGSAAGFEAAEAFQLIKQVY